MLWRNEHFLCKCCVEEYQESWAAHENILFSSCKKCLSKQPKKTNNCRHLGPRRRMEPGTCFIRQQTQVRLGKIVKSRCVSLWQGIVNCSTRDDNSSANKRFHEVCGASAAMCVRGNPWTLLRWASFALANVQTRSRRISRSSRVLLLLLPHHQKTPIKKWLLPL